MAERPQWMPPVLDLQALAYALSLSPRTVESLVATGRLPKPMELSGKRLWRWKDVEAAIAKAADVQERDAVRERIAKATREAINGG